MNQDIELYVWLGLAGLALTSAYLLLWRTRHNLERSRQAEPFPDSRFAPARDSELASATSAP